MKKLLLLFSLACPILAQQVYENAALNSRFTAPDGWAFDTPQTRSDGSVLLSLSRTGLNPAYCQVIFKKVASSDIGFFSPPSTCFQDLTGFYAAMLKVSTFAPGIFHASDTLIGAVHVSALASKLPDQNSMMFISVTSFQNYVQIFRYSTSIQDDTDNGDQYLKNFKGMAYISFGTTAKAAAAVPVLDAYRAKLFDLLGRERSLPIPDMPGSGSLRLFPGPAK